MSCPVRFAKVTHTLILGRAGGSKLFRASPRRLVIWKKDIPFITTTSRRRRCFPGPLAWALPQEGLEKTAAVALGRVARS